MRTEKIRRSCKTNRQPPSAFADEACVQPYDLARLFLMYSRW
jgi:hypothetical protein